MKFEDFIREAKEIIMDKGKDDVKFCFFRQSCPTEHYYFDNCVVLPTLMEYKKGTRAIRALTYDGDVNFITRVDEGEKVLKEFSLSETELDTLLDLLKKAD